MVIPTAFSVTYRGPVLGNLLQHHVIEHVPLQNFFHQMPSSPRGVIPARANMRHHELWPTQYEIEVSESRSRITLNQQRAFVMRRSITSRIVAFCIGGALLSKASTIVVYDRPMDS